MDVYGAHEMSGGYMSPTTQGSPYMNTPGYMPMDPKLTASANNLAKHVGSNTVGYAALFIGGIALVLVVLMLLFYVVIPAPPTLSFGTEDVKGGTTAAPTSIVPGMNTLYNVTAVNDTTNVVKFAQRTSGYTTGVVYYVTNVSTALPITVQTTAASFSLASKQSAMMRVDSSGNSHRIHFAAV